MIDEPVLFRHPTALMWFDAFRRLEDFKATGVLDSADANANETFAQLRKWTIEQKDLAMKEVILKENLTQ